MRMSVAMLRARSRQDPSLQKTGSTKLTTENNEEGSDFPNVPKEFDFICTNRHTDPTNYIFAVDGAQKKDIGSPKGQ
jgi:hypothetical protein